MRWRIPSIEFLQRYRVSSHQVCQQAGGSLSAEIWGIDAVKHPPCLILGLIVVIFYRVALMKSANNPYAVVSVPGLPSIMES